MKLAELLLKYLIDPFLLLNNQNKTKRDFYHVSNLVLLRFPAFPHHFEFARSCEEITMPVTESPSPNLFWGIVLKADKR